MNYCQDKPTKEEIRNYAVAFAASSGKKNWVGKVCPVCEGCGLIRGDQCPTCGARGTV